MIVSFRLSPPDAAPSDCSSVSAKLKDGDDEREKGTITDASNSMCRDIFHQPGTQTTVRSTNNIPTTREKREEKKCHTTTEQQPAAFQFSFFSSAFSLSLLFLKPDFYCLPPPPPPRATPERRRRRRKKIGAPRPVFSTEGYSYSENRIFDPKNSVLEIRILDRIFEFGFIVFLLLSG